MLHKATKSKYPGVSAGSKHTNHMHYTTSTIYISDPTLLNELQGLIDIITRKDETR